METPAFVSALVGEPVANLRLFNIGHDHNASRAGWCRCRGPQPVLFFDYSDGRLGMLDKTNDFYQSEGKWQWREGYCLNIYEAGTTPEDVQAPNVTEDPIEKMLSSFNCCCFRRCSRRRAPPPKKLTPLVRVFYTSAPDPVDS